jgi:ATP-binding cassette subfamily F protein 3
MAMDVGHGYNLCKKKDTSCDNYNHKSNVESVIDSSLLFDCVDLCINEGSRTVILGSNGSGKSTMLRLLARLGDEVPIQGKIHHAHNLKVGFIDQHAGDKLIEETYKNIINDGEISKVNKKDSPECKTALSILQDMYPTKTEQELRGELTAFGLNPSQATTDVLFLSGGERCRLCLAMTMLRDPQILIFDEPTTHLDLDSVEALIHGLKKWNGTVIIVSHDANFIRCLEADCYVMVEKRLCHIDGGIDSYLKAYSF